MNEVAATISVLCEMVAQQKSELARLARAVEELTAENEKLKKVEEKS